MFLWRLSIQNHSNPSITEKRWDKTKYLTWNSIRLMLGKKISMPNPVKSLGYIMCHSSSSPKPVRSPSNPIRYNCEKICSWSRRPQSILEIRNQKIIVIELITNYERASLIVPLLLPLTLNKFLQVVNQGVRNFGFSENFAYTPNEWSLYYQPISGQCFLLSQSAITCLKFTIGTLEQDVRYVQS